MLVSGAEEFLDSEGMSESTGSLAMAAIPILKWDLSYQNHEIDLAREGSSE